MSVTFWMPQAPVERFQPYPEEEPEWFDTRPVAPFSEVNLANGNARAILNLVMPGVDHSDLGGEWAGDTLSQVQRNCMRVLNDAKRREPAYIDPFRSARFYEAGRDDAYVTERVGRLLEIVKAAQEHGFVVCYG